MPPAEEAGDEVHELVAESAEDEEAPAARMDEAWNEPGGAPAWGESAESAQQGQPTDAALASPALDEGFSPEPTGDALGGFRAATSEELQPPLLGPPRAGEEELMWLGDEFEAAGLEIASQGWRGGGPSSPPEPEKPPVFELSDQELAQLARDEGWNPDEVNAIRSFLGRPEHEVRPQAALATDVSPTVAAGVELGPAETDATPAAEAPEAVPAAAAQPPDVARTPAVPVATPEPPTAPETGEHAATQPRRSVAGEPDPEWLRGRRSTAATAYRRLRKLFPG